MMGEQTQPKAIFLDMDGTILDDYNRVSIHTKEIIDHIREMGIPVFIATGRARDEMLSALPVGFTVDGVINSNGMTVYLGDEKLEEHSLPFDLVERIVEQAREHKVYYELFPSTGRCIALKNDYEILAAEVNDPKPAEVGINEWIDRKEAVSEVIDWVEEVPNQMYSKFYCFSKSKEHIDRWIEVLEQLKEWIDFTTAPSTAYNVEITVANVSKATGIRAILNQLQIDPADIIVIGDSLNDKSMFHLAGRAVAMQNAIPEIKGIADEVTDYTCNEEGVYHYLNNLFFK